MNLFFCIVAVVGAVALVFIVSKLGDEGNRRGKGRYR
jgi:hypothetical protein